MLTLTQAYKDYEESKKEGYKNDVATGAALSIFLILLIIQIAFAIFAIYCLVICSHILPVWATILLAITFFIPDIGFFTAIGVIVYYFMKCR